MNIYKKFTTHTHTKIYSKKFIFRFPTLNLFFFLLLFLLFLLFLL